MPYIGPVLVFSGWSMMLVLLLKRKFEECLPAALMLLTVFVYTVTYVSDFRAAVFSGAALPAAVIFGIVIRDQMWKNAGRRKEVLRCFFSPAFFLFAFLPAALLWLNWNRGLMRWDETSHWALMVKETLRINDFYCADGSSLMAHKDYPPIICLFEALFCHLSGGFREGNLYTALQLLELSLFFPLFSKIEWKKKWRGFVTFLAVCLLTGAGVLFCGIADNPFFSSIYEDNVLALELVFGMFFISRQLWLHLCLICIFLLLTKQMGLVFYALVLLFFVVSAVSEITGRCLKTQTCGDRKTSFWKILSVVILLPLGYAVSWSARIRQYGLDQQAQFRISDIRPGVIFDIITGKGGEDWQILTARNYFQALCSQELHHYGVNCSYWLLLFLFAVVFTALYILFRKTSLKKTVRNTGIVLIFGGIGYAFAMFLLYVFNFGPEEGPVLASFERYLGTYLYAVWIMILVLCMEAFVTDTEQKVIFIGGCLGACAAAVYLATGDGGPRISAPQVYESLNQQFEQSAGYLEENTPEDARILFLDCSLDEYHFRYACYAYRYLTNPRIYPAQDWKSRMQGASVEQMKQELQNWDYLYIIHVDESWRKIYGTLFKTGLQDGMLVPLTQ